MKAGDAVLLDQASNLGLPRVDDERISLPSMHRMRRPPVPRRASEEDEMQFKFDLRRGIGRT